MLALVLFRTHVLLAHASRRLWSWLTFDVGQKAMSENSSEENLHPPKGRSSVVAAVALAVVGLAPSGLAAPWGGLVAFYDLNGIGALVVVFWILLLLAAVYAATTKFDRRASAVIFFLWALALFNLGGCGIQWMALDQILG